MTGCYSTVSRWMRGTLTCSVRCSSRTKRSPVLRRLLRVCTGVLTAMKAGQRSCRRTGNNFGESGETMTYFFEFTKEYLDMHPCPPEEFWIIEEVKKRGPHALYDPAENE